MRKKKIQKSLSSQTQRPKSRKIAEVEKLAKFGNFSVTLVEDCATKQRSIRINAASDAWDMSVAEGTMKYEMLLSMIADENLHAALEAWIVMYYVHAHAVMDVEYLEDMKNAIERLNQRNQERSN